MAGGKRHVVELRKLQAGYSWDVRGRAVAGWFMGELDDVVEKVTKFLDGAEKKHE